MFSEAGITDAGKTLWKQRLNRMFHKNLGLKRRIAKGLSYRPVVTPTGIYLGRRMGLQFDEQRFGRVVQKIFVVFITLNMEKPWQPGPK